MADRRFDLPAIDREAAPFWEAAREGRLLIRRCRECGAWHHYPRPFCPVCWSESVEWAEATGRGTVYTHSTVHRNEMPPWGERVPYVAAVVELDEGPRMMTQLVDVEQADLRVGMVVVARFEPMDDDVTRVVFAPA